MIAVGLGILKPTQGNGARTRPKDGALGAVVKGMAMAIGRQDLVLFIKVAAPLGHIYGDTPGQRHATFAAPQRLAGVMHRHQRGGTGGLDIDRRPFEIKDMADAGGEKVLVVAGMAQQEHAHVIHQTRVGADVEIEIAAHATAAIDADGLRQAFGRMGGVFHGAPGDLKKLAVLRVENGRLFGAEAKEFGIKIGKALQQGGMGHIVWIGQGGGGHTRLEQGIAVQRHNGFNAITQVVPIGLHALGAGNIDRHADNGDIAAVLRRA